MGVTTISWCRDPVTRVPGYTFNPWRGCAKVSPACAHCYAEARAIRFEGATTTDGSARPSDKIIEWGVGGKRVLAAESTWRQPIGWNAKAERDGTRPFVFCASLADVFEVRDDLVAPRARLFDLIQQTPNLIWLLLTKRIESVLELVPSHWPLAVSYPVTEPAVGLWPSNVWIGTTVEDQRRADERIPKLLEIPAPVRFLSMEPLLGPVDFQVVALDNLGRYDLDWVIVGDETGHGKRPTDPDWIRSLRDQVVGAGRPFHLKQLGGGRTLDGREWNEAPRPAPVEA